MPNFIPPTEQWLAELLSTLKNEIAALRTQRTEYLVDKNGVCQGIIGNIEHDQNGVATGLTGTGVASHKTGSWVRIV